uniref:Putative secreted protein n=1 Tax=Anopheles triannulatus TaxID=58253 RepID=A0A2M4B360_9DIPT
MAMATAVVTITTTITSAHRHCRRPTVTAGPGTICTAANRVSVVFRHRTSRSVYRRNGTCCHRHRLP